MQHILQPNKNWPIVTQVQGGRGLRTSRHRFCITSTFLSPFYRSSLPLELSWNVGAAMVWGSAKVWTRVDLLTWAHRSRHTRARTHWATVCEDGVVVCVIDRSAAGRSSPRSQISQWVRRNNGIVARGFDPASQWAASFFRTPQPWKERPHGRVALLKPKQRARHRKRMQKNASKKMHFLFNLH